MAGNNMLDHYCPEKRRAGFLKGAEIADLGSDPVWCRFERYRASCSTFRGDVPGAIDAYEQDPVRQLMDFLPWTTFARIVERYGGDRYVKSLRCAEHFRAMAFAQLTYRESLRDIEACLSAQASKLYHMGFRERIRRSTLADANEARDWRIYADFAQVLTAKPESSMQRRASVWNCPKPSMHWIRQRSICACRSSRGPLSAPPRPQ